MKLNRSVREALTRGGTLVLAAALVTAIVVVVAGLPVGGDDAARAAAADADYDLVIRGGTVVDGTGEPAYRADLAIRGDRIVRIARTDADAGPRAESRADAAAPTARAAAAIDPDAAAAIDPDAAAAIDPDAAADVIDAEGLIVSPGFIDNHAHIQTTIHRRPLAENFLRQGITTILASLHSGDQPWPLDEYMARLEMAPNVGFFSGHTWTREQVLGYDDRAPTPEELEEMKALVDASMRAGALGFSTGLRYVPASYAETEEVIELARVAARYGGIYVSHMRDEGPGLIESVAELIRIADEADIPAQINHHKAVGPAQWGWSRRTLAMIDSARAEGLDIKHDLYPYTASSTGSSILFPAWALAGGSDSLAARLADPDARERVLAGMREIMRRERAGDDLARIQFRTVASMPEYDGRTLADLAADRGLPNTIETGIELVAELQLEGGFSAIYHIMDEADLERILRHPWGMIETDGDPLGYGLGYPHPRSYGAFPRVLARYVRDRGLISLEEAVRKMTSLPAEQIGQPERGRIAEGMFADITVFDPERVQDLATFTDPHRYPVGIRHVIVNGVPVVRDASLTGEKPGRVLKGPARPERVAGSGGG